MNDRMRYDYIVIGAGSAGCAVAGRLSEPAENSVVLLEAGGPDSNMLFRIPGLVFMVSTAPEYNWNFSTEPIPELNDRRLNLLYGKVLGGGSSINAMQYTRGNPREYDAWEKQGCAGWGFESVLPYFKKSETNARGAGERHGGSGPVGTRRADPRLPVCDAFLAAAAEAGYPIFDDMNADIDEGFSYSDVNIARGRRMSSSAAYLAPAKHRKNLTVLTRAQALRIIVENGKAKGVEILHDGKRTTLWCEREIVVSAGGVKSPHLLMLSGIGPVDELRRFDIPVVADSPQVGQNFQNHPSYRAQYAGTGRTSTYRHVSPPMAVRAALDYLLFRKGPLGETVVAAGGFFRSDPSWEYPDVQVSLLTALRLTPTPGKSSAWDLLPKEDGVSLSMHGTPYSRGEIRLRSSDPLDHPLIFANYFSDPRDIKILVTVMERLRDIMRRPVLKPFIRAEVLPGEAIAGGAALEADIRRNASHSYHPSGTCAMGGSPSSVVDPQLRVRGVENLRVADASIMPQVLNAGLNGPVMMIGEKAAAMILAS